LKKGSLPVHETGGPIDRLDRSFAVSITSHPILARSGAFPVLIRQFGNSMPISKEGKRRAWK